METLTSCCKYRRVDKAADVLQPLLFDKARSTTKENGFASELVGRRIYLSLDLLIRGVSGKKCVEVECAVQYGEGYGFGFLNPERLTYIPHHSCRTVAVI
jgi:hypothetical protein